MNFYKSIKEEILAKQIKDKHCKRAFLAGVIRGAGTLYEKDGELGLDVKVSDERLYMLVNTYLYSLYKFDLREVAVSRLENPEETLSELAERLNISKSCLNHRMRKLMELAGELE